MIWHIFRKDWKLEWRLALGVALAQVIVSVELWHGAPGPVAMAMGMAAVLARAFLIVETVHNDPLPGVRQDWLVRPIRRSEMLAAKMLFTVLVVQGPVFIADLTEALVEGFSFSSSLEAAFSRSAYMLLIFSLPILAISSLTKNLLEVMASGVFTIVMVAMAQALTVRSGGSPQQLIGTGLGWMVDCGYLLILAALVAAILTMQFRRRTTGASRLVAAVGGFILMGVVTIPWQPAAFALESRVFSTPNAGSGVVLAYEANPIPTGTFPFQFVHMAGKTSMRIPLSVAGLPRDSILETDHYELRAIGSDGVVRAKSQSLEYREDDVSLIRDGEGPVTSLVRPGQQVYSTVSMDTDDYVRLKDRKMRVEVGYSLTLMQLAESYAIPAVNGDERLPGVGRCRTQVNQMGDSVLLNCMQAAKPPVCYSQFLLHAPSGRTNPVNYECSARNYAPYFAQFFPDSVARFGVHLPFHDPTGQYLRPVDAPQIGQAQVIIRNYRTLAHFSRTVTTPERPLRDWLAR